MSERIQTVILCGGMGTRLREETEYRPKPMVEIGNRPILWHIMKLYAAAGFDDFLICLGYKGEVIKDYFLSYEAMNNDFTICLGQHAVTYHDRHDEQGWTVTLADTGQDVMTGARIKRASKYLTSPTFMVTYGDGVGDVDLAALLAFHRRAGRIGTVTGVRPTSRYGEISAAGECVTGFSEKPQMNAELAGLVNGGFFVFERAFLDYLSDEPGCVLEREPIEGLVRDRQLSVYRHPGFWQCMDTYRDYLYLNRLWETGSAPWKIW
jgi:glucose-1-phosphate cytidylyltransferase